MAAIRRKVIGFKIPAAVNVVAADDLNGTGTGIDVSGALRVLLLQFIGTAGTAGIDVVEISHDAGVSYAAATDVLALALDDQTGTVLANGALNAAGVEPTTAVASVFKCGPYAGPTMLRIVRDVAVNANSAAWVTGAPAVDAIKFGA